MLHLSFLAHVQYKTWSSSPVHVHGHMCALASVQHRIQIHATSVGSKFPHHRTERTCHHFQHAFTAKGIHKGASRAFAYARDQSHATAVTRPGPGACHFSLFLWTVQVIKGLRLESPIVCQIKIQAARLHCQHPGSGVAQLTRKHPPIPSTKLYSPATETKCLFLRISTSPFE